MKYQHKMIGRVLVDMGAITAAEIDLILEKLQISGKNFGTTSVNEGFFTEEELAQALSIQYQYEFIDLSDQVLDSELLTMLPSDVPMKYNLVPLDFKDGMLVVAVADPTDVVALDNLELQIGFTLKLKIAPRGQIERLIERGAGSQRVLREASEDFKLQLIKETDRGD